MFGKIPGLRREITGTETVMIRQNPEQCPTQLTLSSFATTQLTLSSFAKIQKLSTAIYLEVNLKLKSGNF